MTRNYDIKNVEHAHFRIDDIEEAMKELIHVSNRNRKDLDSIMQLFRTIRTGIYMLGAIIVMAEVGVLETIKTLIGL